MKTECNTKWEYTSPEIQIVEVALERGFAQSGAVKARIAGIEVDDEYSF